MPVLAWLDADYVRYLFETLKYTTEQVSAYLIEIYPFKDGLSPRNLQRFMSEHNIQIQQRLTFDQLSRAVDEATREVGGTYGRKVMRGYLRLKGVRAGVNQIGAAQRRVAPFYADNRRRDLQRQVNPQTYRAPHFGYNLHFDQNEKLVDYGVVFVLAVDGKSCFITHGAIMCRKNNVVIYRDVFAASVIQYGLWDQIVADKGKEFFLSEFIQHYLCELRIKDNGLESRREPYRQVTSQKNNRVERLWQEVNQRVGFPLKYAFIQLENAGYFHRWDPLHLRAASLLGCAVANVMLQRCIGAWNNHSIPGKGVPADYIPYSGTFPVPDDALPSVDRAVTMYRDKGGHLTDEHTFGVDPLENNVLLKAFRDQCFWFEIETTYKGLTELANNVANHNYMPFQYALLRFIQLTIHFFS